jgi:hypothetical protein
MQVCSHFRANESFRSRSGASSAGPSERGSPARAEACRFWHSVAGPSCDALQSASPVSSRWTPNNPDPEWAGLAPCSTLLARPPQGHVCVLQATARSGGHPVAALPSATGRHPADRRRLDSRNQARRLSRPGPAGQGACPAVHPQRL